MLTGKPFGQEKKQRLAINCLGKKCPKLRRKALLIISLVQQDYHLFTQEFKKNAGTRKRLDKTFYKIKNSQNNSIVNKGAWAVLFVRTIRADTEPDQSDAVISASWRSLHPKSLHKNLWQKQSTMHCWLFWKKTVNWSIPYAMQAGKVF